MERRLLLTVRKPPLHTKSEQRPSGAPYSVLLPTASIVIAYLVVALRDTRPPAAGCNREAGRCFTRFKDGARNAPLEASIAMQDAAKAAADDLMLTTRRWTPVTRVPATDKE